MAASDPQGPNSSRFSLARVWEAAAGLSLAGLVTLTFSGVNWMTRSLPTQLKHFDSQMTLILKNQEVFNQRFEILKNKVDAIDKRVIRLEVNP